jgi:hypothetical protein
MPPSLIQLGTIQNLLEWYSINLCNVYLEDPRHYRVRFSVLTFVHLIQLQTKFGDEPKNKGLTIDQIRSGRINFVKGRFDEQRASELSWAREIATNPDQIVPNWQVLGEGDEAYIKNFGTAESPKFRILICKVLGTLREAWTIFPRERIGEKELAGQLWP